MFRIKICGVTNVPDAIAAVDAGADAIGLNFYEDSSRRVDVETARGITAAINHRSACIGVFVNAEQSTVTSIAKGAALHGIQLHGDEQPDFIAAISKTLHKTSSLTVTELIQELRRSGDHELADIMVQAAITLPPTILIRARRFDDQGVAAIANDLTACRTAGDAPDAILVDALSPGRYGGTGGSVSWIGLTDHPRWLGDTPLILAGGLTPDNVAEAIRIVRPHGVDVASGVESAPGKKDPVKVRDFIAAARAAFGE
jgi:phosphoribosylanthranilate isomerase